MRFLLFLFIIIFATSCGQNKNMKKLVTEEFKASSSEEDIDPPPPHLKETFANLQDWLDNICDSARPQKPISFYSIGIFESKESRVMFLVGMTKTDNQEKIEFRPRNMYFMLPGDQYKGLNDEQFNSKLFSQLVDFTKSKKFSDSYLAESDSILFRGKALVWKNPLAKSKQ